MPDRSAGTRPLGDRLGGRERFAVLFQAFDAEQLRDDRLRGVRLAATWIEDRDRPLPMGLDVRTTSRISPPWTRAADSWPA